MSYIPMHNRLVEGFIAVESSGEMLDPLSSRIDLARPADPEADAALRQTRQTRDAALGAVLAGAGRVLAAAVVRPVRALIGRFGAWRRRERAAVELRAVDDRTLADLGLSRGDLPFILAQGGRERHDPYADIARLGGGR